MNPVRSNGPSIIVKAIYDESDQSVEGIRNTMMQQEALLKEQVQALHRLYNIQKAEMLKLEKGKNHRKLETVLLTNGFSSASGSNVSTGMLVRPVARAYKQDLGPLSLHPFCALKLFGASGSVSSGGSSQSKPVRHFDLEKFPGDWIIDESVQKFGDIDSFKSPIILEDAPACANINSADQSLLTSKVINGPRDWRASEGINEGRCVVVESRSEKSDETPGDGLSTNMSSELLSGDSTISPDSSLSNFSHGYREPKSSHQVSFTSVNGSSEGEVNTHHKKKTIASSVADGRPDMNRTSHVNASVAVPQNSSANVADSKLIPGTGHGSSSSLQTNSAGLPANTNGSDDCKYLTGTGDDIIETPSEEAGGNFSKSANEASSMVSLVESDKIAPHNTHESTATDILLSLDPKTNFRPQTEADKAEGGQSHLSSSVKKLKPSKRKHSMQTSGAKTETDEKLQNQKMSKCAKRSPKNTPKSYV